MQSEFEKTGKLQRKIDVFRLVTQGQGMGANVPKSRKEYVCSTQWHKTVKAALASVSEAQGIPVTELWGRFA